MASFAPDFEHHYHNESFSDLDLEIFENDAGVGEKRKREVTIPGHSMVLMAFSNYCKVKLEHWNLACTTSVNTTNNKKHVIQMPVPVGQADIATRLIKGMYQKTPAVSDLDQQQLLQLLLLADRFEVPKVQAAVVDALSALPEDELEWDTALALLDLPFGSDDEPSYKRIIALADKKLLQKFGDLEMVWEDQQLWTQLLQLPYAALMRLLQHDETLVAGESTVVFTILHWWQKQPQSYTSSQTQHLKDLMRHVRMQHLSLLYINTHMMDCDAVQACFSMRELAIACSCTDPISRQVLVDTKCPELLTYPAWTAAKRPASKRSQVLNWNLPLDHIHDAVDRLLSGQAQVTLSGVFQVYQGHAVRIQARLRFATGATADQSACPSSADKELHMVVFCRVGDAPKAVCSMTTQVFVEAAQNEQVHGDMHFQQHTSSFQRGSKSRPCLLLDIKPFNNWSDVERALRGIRSRRNLVHADDCVHIKVKIIDII